jgi:tRNA(Arg) A34 adenosine deaminase TadA
VSKHVITAIITDKSGKVLSHAQNNYSRTHPIQAHFASLAGEPSRIFLHAEIAALIRLKSTDKPHKIKIERYRKDGSAGLAAPCAVCRAAIKHWKIQYVEFTL